MASTPGLQLLPPQGGSEGKCCSAQMIRAVGMMQDVFPLHFTERAYKIQNAAVQVGSACLLKGWHFSCL